MASKTYTLVTQHGSVEYGSKKTAVKYGDESNKSYSVLSPTGAVVHEIHVPAPDQGQADRTGPSEKETVEDLIGDALPETDGVLFHESLDLPGNYSIVTGPMAVEIADAAGVSVKVEKFPGKLVRRAHFGGDDMDQAKAVRDLVESTIADAMVVLHDWQKKHIEERRGLTDMQKYVQHREVIAKHGSKVARNVKRNGL